MIGGQRTVYETRVGAHVEPGAPYALADFPDHRNLGDSAIYAGQMRFFDEVARTRPDYVCSWATYRKDVARFCPEGTIFLHGGGNFGDIWPMHQKLRLDIIERHAGRKIVQLPQSIHFDDPALISRTARAIGRATDFTLFVRDQHSFDFARRHFDCAVELAPDGAYNLQEHKPAPAEEDVRVLLRTDKELGREDLRAAAAELGPPCDWPREGRWRRPVVARLVERYAAPRMRGSRSIMRHRERLFRTLSEARLATAFDLLSRGRVIVSDRLHAHILSSILRRPHVCLNNSYDKTARYIDTWGDDGLARTVASVEDLRRQVADLGGAGRGGRTA